MFREMRRSDRALPPEVAKAYLEKQEYGVLCVLGDDDYPYGVPISYAYANDYIYIHGFLEGHKIDAVRRHPKVCFTVAGDTEVLPVEVSINYTSVVAFGIAEVLPLEDKAGRKEAFEAIGFKYCPKDENTMRYIEANEKRSHIIRIKVEHMTGKRRPAMPQQG